MDKVLHFEIPTDDMARVRVLQGDVRQLMDMSEQGIDHTIAMTVERREHARPVGKRVAERSKRPDRVGRALEAPARVDGSRTTA
jgi:hypothetical protein